MEQMNKTQQILKDIRKGNYENTSFVFLGYIFRRTVITKSERIFIGFLLAISDEAQKEIRKEVIDHIPSAVIGQCFL